MFHKLENVFVENDINIHHGRSYYLHKILPSSMMERLTRRVASRHSKECISIKMNIPMNLSIAIVLVCTQKLFFSVRISESFFGDYVAT